ncbi:MAG: hypothetical protein IPM29_05595 [Planctomycetes bacterium]|nr:hypothetical protein [Planctomycetota bacterium]
MRIALIATLSALPLAHAVAQTTDNRNLRNNEPYLVQSTATHPTTGVNRNWPPVNPPEFSTAGSGGIPQGTWVVRTMEWQTSRRGEPYQLSGFTTVWRLSAASTGGPTYLPKIRLMKAAPNANMQLDPDFSPAGQFFEIARANGPSIGAGAGIFRINHTFPATAITIGSTNPANLVLQDFAIGAEYVGGEQDDVPASASQFSQSILGTWQDGDIGYVHDGFWSTTNSTFTRKTITDFHTWLEMLTENPSISIFSDYGKRRIAPLSPPLLGNSLGSLYSDINSTAVNEFGFSIRAGTNLQSASAIVLFNFLPQPFPGSLGLPLPGIGILTIELAPFDPNLAAFSTLGLVLDGNGNVDSLPFALPVLAGTLGFHFGFEAVVIDPSLTVADTTEATWVKIRL